MARRSQEGSQWTYFTGLEELHLNDYGRPACRAWRYADESNAADAPDAGEGKCGRCLRIETSLHPDSIVTQIARKVRAVFRKEDRPSR
jgi:hypothetical protein